jgi:hypothetical protein
MTFLASSLATGLFITFVLCLLQFRVIRKLRLDADQKLSSLELERLWLRCGSRIPNGNLDTVRNAFEAVVGQVIVSTNGPYGIRVVYESADSKSLEHVVREAVPVGVACRIERITKTEVEYS